MFIKTLFAILLYSFASFSNANADCTQLNVDLSQSLQLANILYYKANKVREQPKVFQCSMNEIHRLTGDPKAIAGYQNSAIILSADTLYSTSKHKHSLVIHELIHYLQDKDGILASASGCQTEMQAYTLQNEYLAMVGSHESYDLKLKRIHLCHESDLVVKQ